MEPNRRPIRIQPSSDIRGRLKPRARPTQKRERETAEVEPTSREALIKAVDDFVQNSNESEKLNILIGLLKGADLGLLSDEGIFDGVFERILPQLRQDEPQRRISAFISFRLLLVNSARLLKFLDLMVDLYAIRSLDLSVVPERERVEALSFFAQSLDVYREVQDRSNIAFRRFPISAIKSIHSTALQQLSDEDNGRLEALNGLSMAALGVLLKTAAVDPLLVVESCGTEWMVRVLVRPGIRSFPLCTLVSRVLASWLDDPRLRKEARLQLLLEQIFAPVLDAGFLQNAELKSRLPTNNVEELLESCVSILLNLLRTWSGLFACGSTEIASGALSVPLKILSYLSLSNKSSVNLNQIRDLVVGMCCELLGKPYGRKNFTSWADVLRFYCEFTFFWFEGLAKLNNPDMYECSIRDDFVVGELTSALVDESFGQNEVDLLMSFRALVVYFFVSYGLPQSLARMILSSPDSAMSLKATVLLADVIRMSGAFLPKNWRQLMLSTPVLLHLMTHGLLNTVAGRMENRELTELGSVWPNTEYATLVLHRVEELNAIARNRPNIISRLNVANIFVLPNRPEPQPEQQRGRAKSEDEAESERFQSSLMTALYTDETKTKWSNIDYVLSSFRDSAPLLHRWRHNDRCHTFFIQIVEFFAPKHQTFLKETVDTDMIRSGVSAFRLIARLAESEPYYAEILDNYVTDFSHELVEGVLFKGIFNLRNILHTNVVFYFGILSAIGSQPFGYRLLEKTGFYQK